MSEPYSGKTPDFLIIGAGIIGLSIARELSNRHPSAHIQIIDKEPAAGKHASGRNSGVLHAGFYYSPDSLKAKMTKRGNALLTEYCLARKLPIHRCGKLVVARSEKDLDSLKVLEERGKSNGVDLQS